MRILVTGGAGFIGQHLIRSLAKDQAHEVVILDNFVRGRIESFAENSGRVRVVRGDVRDRICVQKVIRGMDVVIHLAAQSNVLGAIRNLDYSFSTNVVGTFEVLQAAKKANVRRVVFASSREVYGEPRSLPVSETSPLIAKNAYGASKIAGEIYCGVFAAGGLETNILRLANVYGPGDKDRVIPTFIDRCVRNVRDNVR